MNETGASDVDQLSRVGKRVLLVILLLAAGLRASHLANHMSQGLSDPESAWSGTDMNAFAIWASRIAQGDVLSADTYHPYQSWMADIAPLETFEGWWGGREVFHQSPLYAYLLGTSYWVTSDKLLLLALQILLSVLSVYLIYRLGRRVADERAGLIGAALAAIYAPSIVFDTMVLRASLGASLTVISIWLLLRVRDTGTARLAFGTGCVLAAGFFLRPVGLVLLLGPVVLLLDARSRASWKRWVPPLVAGALLVFAPFVARNVTVGAPVLAFSTRGPETVIHGNHSGADPGFMTIPGADDYRQLMEDSNGTIPGALLTSIRDWPEDGQVRWWLGHEMRKLLAASRDYEYADNANFYFYRRATPLLAALPTFGFILGLAVVGAVLLAVRGKDRSALLLLALAVGGVLATILLTVASARYRLPIAMLATVPAGVTLSALMKWVSARRVIPVLVCTVAVAVLSVVSFRYVPRRVVFASDQPTQFLRGPDARLFESLQALRVREFTEEARALSQRGEIEAARSFFTDYLEEMRRAVSAIPVGEDPTLRRQILNVMRDQLLWTRGQFAQLGSADLVQAVTDQLDWIQSGGSGTG